MTLFMENLAAQALTPVANLKELRAESGTREMLMVNPLRLKIVDGYNLRDMTDPENIAHVDELAISIAQMGVIDPIMIRFENGEPVVVHGECRTRGTWRAIEHYGAEVAAVPCMIEPKGTTEADRIARMGGGHDLGKKLTTLEKAKGVTRLSQLGWTRDNICRAYGLAATTNLDQLYEINALPDALKQDIKEGFISANLAVQTVKELGEKEATKTLKEGVKSAKAAGKKTAKAVATHINKSKASGPKGVSASAKEAAVKSKVARQLQERIEVIKTLFQKGKAQEVNGHVAIAWTAADYETLASKLGIKTAVITGEKGE